ncbi:hypothetical protein AB4059_04060 [Lysobacter sp. 2RAF19]
MNTQPKMSMTKHYAAALGWIGLFVYSIFLLAGKLIVSETPSIVHLIAPFVLLLVAIRATRRLWALRRSRVAQ